MVMIIYCLRGNWSENYCFFFSFSFPFNRKQNEDSTQGAADQCPDFLSPEQHQLLSGKPSLKGLMERVHEMKQKTFLQVHRTSALIQ